MLTQNSISISGRYSRQLPENNRLNVKLIFSFVKIVLIGTKNILRAKVIDSFPNMNVFMWKFELFKIDRN